MKSRTLFITALLVVGFSFNNCTDSDPFGCGNFGPVHDFFDIRGMSIHHLDDEHNFIETSQIDFSDYGFLMIRFAVDYIATIDNSWSFSLMNQAYGCSPPVPGELGSKEEAIENITIITLNDFDENHMANDTLNDLFLVGFRQSELVNLDTYLERLEGNVANESLYLTLNERPTLNQELQVRIRIDLSTGERYEEISEPIAFN